MNLVFWTKNEPCIGSQYSGSRIVGILAFEITMIVPNFKMIGYLLIPDKYKERSIQKTQNKTSGYG